jgi:hypothetical protein
MEDTNESKWFQSIFGQTERWLLVLRVPGMIIIAGAVGAVGGAGAFVGDFVGVTVGFFAGGPVESWSISLEKEWHRIEQILQASYKRLHSMAKGKTILPAAYRIQRECEENGGKRK